MSTPPFPKEDLGGGPPAKRSNTWIIVLIVFAVLAIPAICVCAGVVGVLVLWPVPSGEFRVPEAEPRTVPSDWGPPDRLRELPAEPEEPQPVAEKPGAGLDSEQEAAIARFRRLGGYIEFDATGSVLTVQLGGTKVTDADLELLRCLSSIQHLNPERTQVTDAGMEHLKGLINLRSVWLHDTKITDEGVKELQQVLPNCEIEH